MIDIPDSMNDFGRDRSEKWRTCHYCGEVTNKAVISFDSGSTLPVEDETLTGATSANTGIVSEVILTSGTWAGGDAAGQILLTTPTGYDAEAQEIFTDNETLTGSTAGADCATVNGVGSLVVDGVMYPEGDMVFYKGVWHCKSHYQWRWANEWLDDVKIKLNEKDRGK